MESVFKIYNDDEACSNDKVYSDENYYGVTIEAMTALLFLFIVLAPYI